MIFFIFSPDLGDMIHFGARPFAWSYLIVPRLGTPKWLRCDGMAAFMLLPLLVWLVYCWHQNACSLEQTLDVRSIYSCFFFKMLCLERLENSLRSLIRHKCRPNCRWGIVCWSSSRRQLITAGHSMGGAQAELFSACANRHRPHHDMVRWAGKMLGHEGGHEDSRKNMQKWEIHGNSQLMFWVCHGQSGLAPEFGHFLFGVRSHLRGLVFDTSGLDASKRFGRVSRDFTLEIPTMP